MQFFGYGPDFMEMLSDVAGFNYSFTLIKDDEYVLTYSIQ